MAFLRPLTAVLLVFASAASAETARVAVVDGRKFLSVLLPPEERLFGDCVTIDLGPGESETMCFDGFATFRPVLVTRADGGALDPAADLSVAAEVAGSHCIAAGWGPVTPERSRAQDGGIQFETCGAAPG